MSTAAGLPVCIQVIGLPFNEEGVLGVAKNI
jgi:Asp-tRNA(Asn)/Glu-tRNA(Gln) amidotransferase A subunit family amidase